ncbi:MAG: DNA polymerase III subunit epsilon, partial [Rickettsiales bacterium]|nr:DNA polymerase III subunit epsilon [Rickettsiales bacterium]
LKFLNAELNALDLPLIEFARATDTVLIARRMFPGSPANLDALCKRFSIDTSARTKHGALLDAELLADVYLELKGGRQSTLLAKATDANHESRVTSHEPLEFTGHTHIPHRQFPPSLEELAAHKAMIEKLKNPLWVAS